MPPTNLIVNGSFDAGNAGWSGNDLETNYNEGAYLGNGSSNKVAEMDGNSSQTTVMEQSFSVTNPTATELTFDSALRTASNPQSGSEGFTAEILDDNGVVIASTTVLPTANTFSSFSLPVNFASPGTYTVRLTELGPDDSLGAIVDNIELLVCFHGATRIDTPEGPRAAREIEVGDMVQTATGPKPVRWVGRRQISAADIFTDDAYRPVKISAGALGGGLPQRDLWVSRQHRMLASSPVCARMFGSHDVLISAIRLTALPGIYVDEQIQDLDYVHFLFDDHEIVYAEAAPSESLLLGDQAQKALSPAALAEIELIFPQLRQGWQGAAPAARLIPSGARQKRLVARLGKNRRPVLDAAPTYAA